MGEKNIKNDMVKKKKKTDLKPAAAPKPVVPQPEIVTKKKKPL